MAIVGEEFREYVQKQIIVRQKTAGSGVNENRTPEQIVYLNTKSSWVKFASAVQVTPERIQKENLLDVYANGKLAQSFVLFGGISSLESSDGKNILKQRGTSPTSQANIWGVEEGTYNVNAGNNPYTTSKYGLVPMPGINSVDVKYLNRGSIKKATLKIKAYSPEQFQVLDLIYMRLGYTMFLEWGTSPYLDNEGNLQHGYTSLIENPEGFFNYKKWEERSFIKFGQEIEKKRKELHGNYEGMLCKVSNFSWDFSSDGSYDITLNLISMGDVIESLKTNLSPPIPVLNFISANSRRLISNTKEEGAEIEPVKDYISALIQTYRIYTFLGRDSPQGYTNANPNAMDNGITFNGTKSSLKENLPSIWVQPVNPNAMIGLTQGGTLDNTGGILGAGTGNMLNKELVGDRSYDFSIYDYSMGDLKKELNRMFPDGWNNTVSRYGGVGSGDGDEDTDFDGAITLDKQALEKRPGVWVTLFDPIPPRPNTAYIKVIPDPELETFMDRAKNEKDVCYINYNNMQTDEDMIHDSGMYMRFGYILKFIQDFIVPRIKSGEAQPITEEQKKRQDRGEGEYAPSDKKNHTPMVDVIFGEMEESNRMYTLPYQVSLDPRICIVSTPSWEDVILPGTTIGKYFHKGAKRYKWKDGDEAYGNCMNIYVNCNHLYSSLTNATDEAGNVDLFSLIDGLCKDFNRALGGINNLEPIINQETNEMRIIDGSYIPKIKSIPEYKLELYGYNSNNNDSNFVRKLNIKTEITNDFASMISIGATAGGYTKGMANTMFSKWNEGVIDIWKEEIIPADTYQQDKVEKTVTEVYIETFLAAKNFYRSFGLTEPADVEDDVWTKDLCTLDENAIESNISNVTEYYRYVQSLLYKQSKKKYSSPTNGFVPISLSLTLDGIGGMKIYNTLRTNTEFLPSRYPENLKFIIKNVGHSIKNGVWETKLDTVVIANNEDENFENVLTYKEIKKIIDDDLQGKTVKELLSSLKTSVQDFLFPPLKEDTAFGNSIQPKNWPYYAPKGSSTVPKEIEDENHSGVGSTFKNKANPPSSNRRVSANSSIKSKYIPKLNKINENRGLKILALAMAIKEGYYPNTRSYKTNNPGNIGNTDAGGNNTFNTLTDGIQAQMNYLKKVAIGKHRAYPLNKKRDIKPYYSPEIAKNTKSYQLTPYLPGYEFTYTGKLDQFIKIYSTGARGGNTYLSDIISIFKKNGITITSDTTLKKIVNIKGGGKVIV